MSEEKEISLNKAQLKFVKSSYNGVWELLDKSNRTPEDDENLILGAFASLHHWKQVGTVFDIQRGY